METIQLDSQASLLRKPTHQAVVTTTRYKKLHIGVGVVDARRVTQGTSTPEGKTIIWPLSYQARLDALEIQRLVTIAEALHARVIGIEAPGVGAALKARTTLLQKIDLLMGSFDSMADAMLGALHEVGTFSEGDEVEFMLFSQGAALGVSMIKLLGENAQDLAVRIPRVTILEAVNDQPWNLRGLYKATSLENRTLKHYLEENNTHDWLQHSSLDNETNQKEQARLNRKQAFNLFLLGFAMHRAFTPTLLKALRQDIETPGDNQTGISHADIRLIKFADSRLSRLEENERTIEQIRSIMKDGRATLVVLTNVPGRSGYHHPAVHSMNFVDALVRNIAV